MKKFVQWLVRLIAILVLILLVVAYARIFYVGRIYHISLSFFDWSIALLLTCILALLWSFQKIKFKILPIFIWIVLSALIACSFLVLQVLMGLIRLEAFVIQAFMIAGMFIIPFKLKNKRIKWILYFLISLILLMFLAGIVIGFRTLFHEEFTNACHEEAIREYCGDCYYIGKVDNVFTGCSLELHGIPGGG